MHHKHNRKDDESREVQGFSKHFVEFKNVDGLICCAIFQYVLSPLGKHDICGCYAALKGRLSGFLSAVHAPSRFPLPSRKMDEIQ